MATEFPPAGAVLPLVRCPVCQGAVHRRTDGTLLAHDRYADGAGPGPRQPHTLVQCEGWYVDPERSPL